MKKIKKINENEIMVDGCVYRKVEEPEFKEGEWIYWNDPVYGCQGIGKSGIGKYTNDDTNATGLLKGDKHIKLIVDGEIWKMDAGVLRHATKGEIESHLKKICDEKYPKGTKFRSLSCDSTGIVSHVFSYYIENDQLTNGDTIYSKGKWADIIPDKKKLPKTRKEYEKFLDDFWHKLPDDLGIDGLNIDEFLKDYE